MQKLVRGNPVAVSTDWYRDADPDLRREYDEFGPWVLSIRSEADMPPRYREWYADHRDAAFLLKVPREVERRLARPGDDLYKAVLALHDDFLCALTLSEGVVTEQNIRLSEVEAIHVSEIMLWGHVRLWLQGGGEWAFSYNTVSSAVVLPFVDALRRTVSGPRQTPAAPPLLVQDYFFSALTAEHLRRVPENHVVFCEDPKPRVSTGLLVLDCGSELTFLTQGATGRRSGKPTLGHHGLYVPKRRLMGVEVHEKLDSGVVCGHELKIKIRDARVVDFALVGDGASLVKHLSKTAS